MNEERDDDSNKTPYEAKMLPSMFRFASDWLGGDLRHQAAFRNIPPGDSGNRDDRIKNTDAVIELEPLMSNGGSMSQETRRRALIQKYWLAVGDIDVFLEQVYAYYLSTGYYGFLFGRIYTLLTIHFLVGFSVFLRYCVKWDFLTRHDHFNLSDVIDLSGITRISWPLWIPFIVLAMLLLRQWIRLLEEIPALKRTRGFYEHVLEISDDEVHLRDFSQIMENIHELQQQHPISRDKLDAREICNRLMRRENYLIALMNKEMFDSRTSWFTAKPSLYLTKTLEWNLLFTVMNFFFEDSGRGTIRRGLEANKDKHVAELNKRLIAVGIANLVLAPLILVLLAAYFIFKHGEETYGDPKILLRRQYTSAARWKFREFNELPHEFEQRLANSQRKASKYMEQFGTSRWTPLAKLVTFITGSFAVVLLAITIANDELLLKFELSPGKGVIWYLGLLGLILAISRSFIPDLNKAKDPTKLMQEIIEYTHYQPKHWRGNLHSPTVHQDFSHLYSYRLTMLLSELLSVITTPFILIFALPQCSGKLVDFFREFTVHVDGLGYVCSFALFDFERHGNPKMGGRAIAKEQRTKQGKMEKSFLTFVANNPRWDPGPENSRYLTKVVEESQVGFLPGDTASVFLNRLAKHHSAEDSSEEKHMRQEDEAFGLMSILDRYYKDI